MYASISPDTINRPTGMTNVKAALVMIVGLISAALLFVVSVWSGTSTKDVGKAQESTDGNLVIHVASNLLITFC